MLNNQDLIYKNVFLDAIYDRACHGGPPMQNKRNQDDKDQMKHFPRFISLEGPDPLQVEETDKLLFKVKLVKALKLAGWGLGTADFYSSEKAEATLRSFLQSGREGKLAATKGFEQRDYGQGNGDHREFKSTLFSPEVPNQDENTDHHEAKGPVVSVWKSWAYRTVQDNPNVNIFELAPLTGTSRYFSTADLEGAQTLSRSLNPHTCIILSIIRRYSLGDPTSTVRVGDQEPAELAAIEQKARVKWWEMNFTFPGPLSAVPEEWKKISYLGKDAFFENELMSELHHHKYSHHTGDNTQNKYREVLQSPEGQDAAAFGRRLWLQRYHAFKVLTQKMTKIPPFPTSINGPGSHRLASAQMKWDNENDGDKYVTQLGNVLEGFGLGYALTDEGRGEIKELIKSVQTRPDGVTPITRFMEAYRQHSDLNFPASIPLPLSDDESSLAKPIHKSSNRFFPVASRLLNRDL
ncbi:hypothetical protein T439DRAFT_354051 [Meredithblackwellia eburnea MCA 4105]